MLRPLFPLLLIAGSTAAAQEPIQFARTPDISPDGKTVAFSYLGDIWTVEAIGGVARPVTMHEAHDYAPVFSPDGRQLAFSSNRHGGYDVFVVPVQGGKPKRLTFDSGADIVCGWTPDGRNVVFSSGRSAAFPANPEMSTVPVDGGAEKKLNLFEAKDAQFSQVGNKVAFVRGPGAWNRRGYRGSSNDDIYLANRDGTDTTRLTTFDGQDGAPMFSPDGKKLYYVTENGSKDKCANIVCQELDGLKPVGSPRNMTNQTDDLIRRARISGNGEWIVYEQGGDLWVVGTKSGSVPPRKLAIEVHADDKSNTDKSMTYTRDATDYALSPDETHAVIVVHGQLFLTKVPAGGKATRLTEHAFADAAPNWSPDGKRVIFTSDRGGTTDVYAVEADDSEHPEFTKAHKFKTTQLTKGEGEEIGPTYSPKGDRIAFIRRGQLWTMKPDGTEAKPLVDDKKVVDYDWSPDGKHVAFSRVDGSFASEMYIVPTDASAKPKNVSRYATYNSDPSWSQTGGKLAFISQRQDSFNMHVLSLQKPVADGAAKPDPNDIEWEDIHLRVTKPAAMPAYQWGGISADGSQVAFRSRSDGQEDLWVVNSSGGSLNRLTSGGQQPRLIRWAKKNVLGGTIYFLNGLGELRYAKTSMGGFSGPGGPVSEPPKVPFVAKLNVKRDDEFNEMFAQSWKALADNFYDAQYHGADWTAVRAKYAPLVPHCATREDLYSLVTLMLGELNASHLGISGNLPLPQENTADLGLLFDDAHAGPGLKVAEVLKRGPADKKGFALAAGDVITHIDRVELTAGVNVSKLLNAKAGEGVLLTLATEPGKGVRRVEVVAVGRERTSQLMYERWVTRNADAVAKQSGGKLGYIHIPSMDDDGLNAFVRSLYSDNFDKEAIVLDVRYNGGGFTHDKVLNYLNGKEHTKFVQRDGGDGFVLRDNDRKFAKPLVVLTNNRSYSDAEIFPHAFRASGLGKVVGQATGGLVIGTTSTRLIDGSTFRLPRTGVFTNKNENMDKVGVKPDVAVEITADDWAKGVDSQIAKAVQVLTADVAAWKKAKGLITAVEPTTAKPIPPAETQPVPPTDAKPTTGEKPKLRRAIRPAR